MSLITRCPACATMFKVVRDQLRISGGWVRCGQCAEVFDASAHMVVEGALVAAAPPPPQPAPVPRSESTVVQRESVPEAPARRAADAPKAGAASAPVAASVGPAGPVAAPPRQPSWWTPSAAWSKPSAAPSPTDDGAPEKVQQRDVDQRLDQPLPDAASAPSDVPAAGVPWTASELMTWRELEEAAEAERASAPPARPATLDDAPAPAQQEVSLVVEPPLGQSVDPVEEVVVAEVLSPEPASEPEPQSEPETAASPSAMEVDFVLSDVGRLDDDAPPASAPAVQQEHDPLVAPAFVAQARRRAFWSSRPVRAVLWLIALLLALGLALQWVVGQRDWLAAREPRLVPLLQAVCEPLGCRLAPYRMPDAVVIDSSAFNRVNTNTFRFGVTLRNMADIAVATPALELTLTDAQDQPLLRRVVSAAELGAPATLGAHGEFSGTNELKVNDIPNPGAIVGYRLMAFYP